MPGGLGTGAKGDPKHLIDHARVILKKEMSEAGTNPVNTTERLAEIIDDLYKGGVDEAIQATKQKYAE